MTVAGLQPFQTVILPSTLYAVYARPSQSLNRSEESGVQLAPNIEVAGNAADVYVSQVLPESAPTGMTKLFSAIQTVEPFTFVPNYLYIDPTGSDPTAIVLTGIHAAPLYSLAAAIYSLTSVSATLVGHATNALAAAIYSQTFVSATLTSP